MQSYDHKMNHNNFEYLQVLNCGANVAVMYIQLQRAALVRRWH